MAAPCGNKTSRGYACYPLTTYCPNRPATYKRDTTGRPAKSAIYKPDIQPKPRPHAYTHAYTGTPARLHPRKTHCTHPRTHTTARGPAKSQVMSEKGHQKRPKQAESHPHPLTDKQNQPNSQVVSKGGATQHQNSPKHPESYPHPLTTAPKPSKPQVMSKRGIKSVRNRPNNTPIRSQPMLQHDSGHMRTATTPLRNIRHAHARKHKYTH